jgi:hypothetical protein
MKEFFKLRDKGILVMIVLEVLMVLLGVTLINLNNLPVSLFNLNAFIVACVIWGISALLEKKTYYTFWDFLAIIGFVYICFWVLFELTKIVP